MARSQTSHCTAIFTLLQLARALPFGVCSDATSRAWLATDFLEVSVHDGSRAAFGAPLRCRLSLA